MVAHTDVSYGILPPSREGLLEIQLNKLINDYLFSDSEERTSSISLGAEANGSNFALKTGLSSSSSHEIKVCNVDESQTGVLEAQVYSSCENMRTILGSYSKQDLHISSIVEDISSSSSSSSSSKCMQETYRSKTTEEKRVNSAVQLARLGTFPCKSSNIENKVDNVEVKNNSRKPPRPPNQLMRCSSDTMLLHRSRSLKLERRKKMMSASGGGNGSDTSTSLWALIFTVLFAIVMLAQGNDISIRMTSCICI